MMNQRSLERFQLNLSAKIEVIDSDRGKDVLDLLTSNICSGGAFFQTDRPLSEGIPVKVDLILPLDRLLRQPADSKRVHVVVTGRVIRSDPHGMAVGFNRDYKILPIANGS